MFQAKFMHDNEWHGNNVIQWNMILKGLSEVGVFYSLYTTKREYVEQTDEFYTFYTTKLFSEYECSSGVILCKCVKITRHPWSAYFCPGIEKKELVIILQLKCQTNQKVSNLTKNLCISIRFGEISNAMSMYICCCVYMNSSQPSSLSNIYSPIYLDTKNR